MVTKKVKKISPHICLSAKFSKILWSQAQGLVTGAPVPACKISIWKPPACRLCKNFDASPVPANSQAGAGGHRPPASTGAHAHL